MNHCKPYIPQKYTHYAKLSSIFILQLSITCFQYDEFIQGGLLFTLYCTTLLHWNCVKTCGFYLHLDKNVVKINFLYSIISAYKYECSSTFYIMSLINVIAILLNNVINKQTILNEAYLQKASPVQKHWSYVRACVVHMFFLHFLQIRLGIWVIRSCEKQCKPILYY